MEIGAKRRLERKARPRSGTPKCFAPGSARPAHRHRHRHRHDHQDRYRGIRTIVATGVGVIGVVTVTRRTASAVVRTWWTRQPGRRRRHRQGSQCGVPSEARIAPSAARSADASAVVRPAMRGGGDSSRGRVRRAVTGPRSPGSTAATAVVRSSRGVTGNGFRHGVRGLIACANGERGAKHARG